MKVFWYVIQKIHPRIGNFLRYHFRRKAVMAAIWELEAAVPFNPGDLDRVYQARDHIWDALTW